MVEFWGGRTMPGPRSQRVPVLPVETRERLEQIVRSPSLAAGLVRRARIVLLAAEGVPLRRIGAQVGVDRNVVRDWLDRFQARGLEGLRDLPRPGRARAFPPRGEFAAGPAGV